MRGPQIRDDGWAQKMPPRQELERIYQADGQNRVLQTETEYLTWVVSFYNGRDIFRSGWETVELTVLKGTEERGGATVKTKFDVLGRLIASDWARHNSVRRINTQILTVWGDVLRAAVDQARIMTTIDQVTADVLAIQAGTLAAKAIHVERYRELLGLDLASDELDF